MVFITCTSKSSLRTLCSMFGDARVLNSNNWWVPTCFYVVWRSLVQPISVACCILWFYHLVHLWNCYFYYCILLSPILYDNKLWRSSFVSITLYIMIMILTQDTRYYLFLTTSVIRFLFHRCSMRYTYNHTFCLVSSTVL